MSALLQQWVTAQAERRPGAGALVFKGERLTYEALELACRALLDGGAIDRLPLTGSVAAVSCGVVDGEPLLDLDYPEDSNAEVDINVVSLGRGGLVEVQGTGEGGTFSRAQLDQLHNLAEAGIDELTRFQRECLGSDWPLSR